MLEFADFLCAFFAVTASFPKNYWYFHSIFLYPLCRCRCFARHALDKLTAQREKCVAIVDLIPDQTARTVIKLCYQLSGSGCEKMPYFKIGEALHYSDKTILRYHKKAIDQLNQLLEGEKA